MKKRICFIALSLLLLTSCSNAVETDDLTVKLKYSVSQKGCIRYVEEMDGYYFVDDVNKKIWAN